MKTSSGTPARIGCVLVFAIAVAGAFGQVLSIPPAPAAIATPPPAPAPEPPTPLLKIQADRVKTKSSPLLFGIMTEEINHSYEGGLYAELIANRSFQDVQGSANWDLIEDAGAAGKLSLDPAQPFNATHPVSLKIEVTTASPTQRFGVANRGFWGIPVKPDTRYRASFYAKAAPGFAGPLTLDLESADGKNVWARGSVTGLTGEWQRYTLTLSTAAAIPPSSANRLVLLASGPGTVWLDLVSLFPTWNDRPNGLRPDLMQLLADLQPGFLRFPGGNYVEGKTPATRYDWKKTIGPIEDRPGHQDDSWGYHSTDGLGLMEYLTWCEDLKMEPVLAVFAGLFLSNRPNPQTPVIPAGPDLEPYVQDALDEIEYITGDPGTKWGAQRAKDGHPAPFHLKYVEIGNEDNLSGGGATYGDRFAQFYDAIKKKYPDLQLIATTNVTTRQPDLRDDHTYSPLAAMEGNATRYDDASRTGPRVMFGEYATQSPGNQRPITPNLENALGDAAFLTGLERNSDLVLMSSYAPLFVNVNPGASQWRTDLIGYDALASFASPSYYVQKMFNETRGDEVLVSGAENVPTVTVAGGRRGAPRQVPSLYFSATHDSGKGTIYVRIVNTAADPQPLRIQIAGAPRVVASGHATVLTSDRATDENSIATPLKVSPFTASVSVFAPDFTQVIHQHSVTILQIETR